jgi:hypothetical protein
LFSGVAEVSIWDIFKEKEQPPFNVTVHLPPMDVTFCYPLPEGCHKVGEATKGRITIEGRVIKGSYVPITLEALGHEFQHILNIEHPGFANPDREQMT